MHIPVLSKEVIDFLSPELNQNFIDGTCGAAGHALAILEKNYPSGRILCIDWDSEALVLSQKMVIAKDATLTDRAIFVNDNYANLSAIVKEKGFRPINGILLDLGMSSDQLEMSGRGFSFLKNEPLDMRYSLEQELTAWEILNHWREGEIEKILKEYGEEPWAKKISKEIIKNRKSKPILSTAELAEIIARTIPRKFHHGRKHIATRTFQALRIAVNDELGNLQKFLPQAENLLEKDGRLVIISFHSLEDRIVKNFFREQAKKGKAVILTKKPVIPGREEIKQNPRSRSAKLRAIKKS